MDMGIKNLRVAISGAAAGIGLEMARRFVEEGAHVCVSDANPEAVAALKDTDPELKGSVCDVSDRNGVGRWIDTVRKELGGIDCLINNAGIAGPTARVDDVDPAEWDRTLAINITGQFNLTRLVIADLAQSRNASILNLSSAAGRLGFALRTPYAASKWAVIGFTKSLSKELGPMGIRVNAMLPGLVDGQRIQNVFAAKAKSLGISPEQQQEAALAQVSMRKLVPMGELADMAVYLASPRARTISGQSISICGDLDALK